MEMLTAANAIAAYQFGLTSEHLRQILLDCAREPDWIAEHSDELDSVGFWRVEKDQLPEHRQTVLSLIAFETLLQNIRESGNESEALARFASVDGWTLPETLCLADYSLNFSERSNIPQPVAAAFGDRLLPCQLDRSPTESWAECRLHVRNLYGPNGLPTLQQSNTRPASAREADRSQSQARLFE